MHTAEWVGSDGDDLVDRFLKSAGEQIVNPVAWFDDLLHKSVIPEDFILDVMRLMVRFGLKNDILQDPYFEVDLSNAGGGTRIHASDFNLFGSKSTTGPQIPSSKLAHMTRKDVQFYAHIKQPRSYEQTQKQLFRVSPAAAIRNSFCQQICDPTPVATYMGNGVS